MTEELRTPRALYALLELPEEVAEMYSRLDRDFTPTLDAALRERVLCRATWPEAVKEWQARIGDDPDGLLILHEMLLESLGSWKRYQEKGIPLAVFADTMRFASRYLRDRKKAVGRYGFTAPWWFPRELALQEFRLGALEFEMAEEEKGRVIEVHIPSDAKLAPSSVDDSFARCRAFLAAYYPGWTGLPWYCDSWMLSPELPGLLKEGSNILAFQRRFAVEEFNRETHGAVSWVFPGHREPSADLQEDTSLQRAMKAFLLSGGCVGWARGRLKEAPDA